MYVFACIDLLCRGTGLQRQAKTPGLLVTDALASAAKHPGMLAHHGLTQEGAGQPETRHSSAEVPARGSHVQTNAALPATTSAPPVHSTQLRGAAPCGGCPAGPGRHSAESGAGCAGKVACASAQVSVMLVSRCSSAGASAVPTRTWPRAQASREPPARQARADALTLYPTLPTNLQRRRRRGMRRARGSRWLRLAQRALSEADTRRLVRRRRPLQQRALESLEHGETEGRLEGLSLLSSCLKRPPTHKQHGRATQRTAQQPAPRPAVSTRACAVESRSRSVTVPSSSVRPSTVSPKGTPSSSVRAYLRPMLTPMRRARRQQPARACMHPAATPVRVQSSL